MKKLARRGLSLVLSLLMILSLAYTDVSFVSNAEESNHVWTKVSLSDITSSDSIAITMTTSDGTTYVLPNASATKAGPAAVLGTVDGSSLTIEEGKDADYAWTITKNTVEETVVTNAENNTEAEVTTVEEKTVTEEAGTIASEEKASEEKTEEVSETTEEKTVVEATEASEEKPATEEVSEKTTEKKAVVEDNKEVSAEEAAETAEESDKKDSDAKDDDVKTESEEKITRTFYTITNGSSYLYTNASNSGVRVDKMPKDQVGAQWQLDDNGYLSAKDSKDATRFLGVYLDKKDWRAYTNVTGNIKNQTLGFYKLTSKVADEGKVAAPQASVESGTEVEFGAQIELTCATEDAKIYYNVNGSEDNYSPYKEAVAITKDTTIYAYSVVDETKSEIVSFNYKLIAGSKITDITKLDADQEFVLSFNNEKVLATEASGKKLAGVDVKVNDDNHLTYTEDQAPIASLKLVKAEKDGEFYITSDILEDNVLTTKYLTSGETGNSLTFAAEKNDYSLWSIEPEEDGAFLVKNVNAVFKNKAQYLEFYSGFTTYSYTAGGKKDNYTFSAYTVPELEKVDAPTDNTVGKLLTRELYDGDQVVVYYPAGKKLMTSEATTNGKLKDVAAEPAEDGTLETKDLNAAVLSVARDDNGYYSFKTADGKYLTGTVEEKEVDGKKKTYANLILADEKTDNSLWTEEAASAEGKYYLKNAFAKSGSYVQALEYYSGFSLYGFKESAAYEFSFYALAEGEKTVNYEFDDTRLTVAQWAGNAHYDEVETTKEYINGDLYATNDMLDSSAKYTAVVNGSVSQPWTSAKSSNTGSTNYYMGSTGVINKDTDYMQFAFPSLGYGNMSIDFRMRASNTAAGEFQLQYSTDGETFKNLKTGTYSFKYTAYKASEDKVDENGKAVQEPFEVSGSGDITDGIAKTSLAPTYYVTFSFDIPNAAANAEKLYVRLVPVGDKSAKGDKAPAKGGVIRIDGVDVKGNPIVSDDMTSYVVASPAAGEIPSDQKVSLSSKTEGADIYYSVNGGEFVKYDSAEKVSFTELPATIRAYATKEGLAKSITVNYQYTQAQVAPVKAAPNGGAVFEGQRITLKTKTEGAKIFYRYEEVKDDAESTDEVKTSEEESTEEPVAEDEHDDWIEYTAPFELKELPAQIQVKATKDCYKDSAVSTLKFTKKLNEKYNIYFGQVHAHTSISDGAGTLEEALQHASKVDNLDYIVITDHSNSIDNEKESKITENVDKSENDEWTYAHNLVKKYSTDKFTCAYGYEMTWSNGLGHINTYNTPGFQSRTQTAYSTYATALQNYYEALRSVPDSISQFNHPGTTFGDFQDFAYYSEENDALITMIEVGNGEGTIGSSGYFPSYEYYTRALDKGWHVAPTNNQDNHKGKWGDANTARTVMLADTNDENAIYDAMRNYRIYATEDNDLSVYYTLDNYIMGTILEKDAVGDTVQLKAEIKDPTDSKIGRVEVIVNGGQSIAMENVATNEKTVTFEVPANYSYYYLKITEDDGDIAVTAPVWVGEVEACGINKTYTNTVLPVKGESLDVNVDFYNNEQTDLTIDNIQVVIKDVDNKETEVVNLSGAEAGITSVKSQGTATFKTDFVYNEAGQVTYEVIVNATLNGVPKVYTDKLQLSYAVPEMVTDVLIDGTHYNDYVTGYYGGNMSAFVSICAKKNIRAQVVTTEITPEMLEKCSLLVVSAPAKKSGTANAGDYTVSHFSDEFITTVKNYVANGGSVIVCGLADYSDTTDGQTATEQNKLLEAIGSTIRMGSDEVCDDTNNGGQVYRMYPTTYNTDSALFAGLRDGQKYSQYSGCSVDISNAKATDFVDEAQWLVKGFDTTYSVDCKDASGNPQPGTLDNGVKGAKNDNLGDVTFLATQHTKAGGDIFVAGGVFISDFEVKAEMDNNDSLPYTNHTIINNILEGVTVELPTSTIAQARAGKMNEVFAVEGYVTSGTDNEYTTFFDTIYLQDETAGIDIFPYATPGLAIGTKMRIVGYVSQYQGDKELKVISSKILDAEPHVYAPKEVDTKTAMDYDALGGSLLKTTGKVTRVAYGSDGKTIEEFWLKDSTGVEAAIFIDGYIYSATTGKNEIASFVKEGATVSAAGVLYMHPEGDSEESVPVFRVRNCDDIVLVKEPEPEVKPDPVKETIKQVGKVVKNVVETVEKTVQKVAAKNPVVKKIVENPVVKQVVSAIKSFLGKFFGW
ncbi:CehA/McbA family metallohydrolase [Pseudobutyrivibrio xylanivorans]|uniref:Chitobiase/beta-hexosaminidase C-terminal domain-containing protein n=1 Tax=Pseudobutyrivibrio xylanivorans DSM 14809 TaxID=1123012 RepID=A0A1M6E1N7_PSEXY|nr:CehA/McbA family metallohydrolase [Pseudobutyrivibrio xylanivorans]SHI79434.1 Chitobiase/beta-hexosaminidase C-terminal domain-containing protein [Pseudobutyrivibrio xylanivorans DSM 14809]